MADNTQTNPSPESAGAAATEAAGEGSSQGGFSDAFTERAGTVETPAPAADTAATTDESAASADTAQAPPEGAADASSGTNAAPAFDPYAGLTPEQKAHFERLAASERSNRGRVGALTKKLNGLASGGTQQPPAQAETGASHERSDEGAGGTDTGNGTGETQATDIEARLKAVTEEYGDILGPLPELITGLRKEIGELKASATRHEVDQDAQQLTQAYAALEAAHPDYEQVAANPAFHDWLGKQPQGVQALANSFDPAEVSLSLQLFKAESTAASAASTGAGQGGSGSTATGDRRERQMEGLSQTPNKGAPAAAGVPKDFDAAFSARSAQHAKR